MNKPYYNSTYKSHLPQKEEVENIVSLFLFLVSAVWEDYHTQKISNSLIITALVSAFLYQIRQQGFQSILYSFFHVCVIVFLLFPLYLCKALGAGDIKLLGVTAVFLSWRHAFMAFISGVYLALIHIIFLLLYRKRAFGNKIPMSGPILGGILIVMFFYYI